MKRWPVKRQGTMTGAVARSACCTWNEGRKPTTESRSHKSRSKRVHRLGADYARREQMTRLHTRRLSLARIVRKCQRNFCAKDDWTDRGIPFVTICRCKQFRAVWTGLPIIYASRWWIWNVVYLKIEVYGAEYRILCYRCSRLITVLIRWLFEGRRLYGESNSTSCFNGTKFYNYVYAL